MRHRKHNKETIRVVIAGVFLGLFAVVIAAKSIHLQVFRQAWLSEKAVSQYQKAILSHGKRGVIFDRNYGEMAVSIDVPSIAAYPQQIKQSRWIARKLATELQINRRELHQKLQSKNSFVWVKRQVTPKETETVKRLNLGGIGFVPEHTRFYPNRTLAAQVIGFSGVDGRGLEGLEYYYDTHLQGEIGKSNVIRDALGRGLKDEGTTLSDYRGGNLVLTIDRNIQYITEEALAEAVQAVSAKSGIAMVMSPETGGILAMAHYPFFNPNDYRSYTRGIWRNRAVTDPYEPGSTLKIFTVAAALRSKMASPNTIFFAENGRYRIGRFTINDVHPHSWLTLKQVVKFSSNIGATKVGELVGREALYSTLLDFGFGAKTGIDCPGETAGRLSHFRKWSNIDAGTIAFGQGISVSPIQLITAVSAIANGGYLMKPQIVEAVIDKKGRERERFLSQKKRRVISRQTANILKNMMKSVLEKEGTGENAALSGYSAGGKTGTSQKVGPTGTYEQGKYISSFIGFAPVENPAIAVLVVVDEPKGKYYGGVVAAPVFRKIAQKTLIYLNILPDQSTGKLTAQLTETVAG